MIKVEDKIIIFTDGASKGNPGPGGYGAVVIQNNYGDPKGAVVTELGGFDKHTTNNRMELMGAIKALSHLPSLDKEGLREVEIYTDSKYLIGGMTAWIFNWQKNKWRTADKKPVANQDLWETLSELVKNKKIKWHYVAGHTGHPANERCDEIASGLALGKKVDLYDGLAQDYPISLNLPGQDE